MSQEFADRLIHLRGQQNLTQQDLGEAAEVSPSQISRYESGLAMPRKTVMRKLADALGVTTEELAGVQPKGKKLTIDIPPEVSAQLRQVAEETGKTFEEVVTETLEWGILRFGEDPEFAANVLKGIEARRHTDSK